MALLPRTQSQSLKALVMQAIPQNGISCGELFEQTTLREIPNIDIIDCLHELRTDRDIAFEPHEDAMKIRVKRTKLSPLDVAGDLFEMIPYTGITWNTLFSTASTTMTPADIQLKLMILQIVGLIQMDAVPLTHNPIIWRTGGHPNVVSLASAFR